MLVEIPSYNHFTRSFGKTSTVNIMDTCPKCGCKRGVRKGRGGVWSKELLMTIDVDRWVNECEHIDTYIELWKELEAETIYRNKASFEYYTRLKWAEKWRIEEDEWAENWRIKEDERAENRRIEELKHAEKRIIKEARESVHIKIEAYKKRKQDAIDKITNKWESKHREVVDRVKKSLKKRPKNIIFIPPLKVKRGVNNIGKARTFAFKDISKSIDENFYNKCYLGKDKLIQLCKEYDFEYLTI